MAVKNIEIPVSTLHSSDILLDAMGMSHCEHNQRIFSAGVKYFELLEPISPYREEILYSTKLWRWWTKQWYRRNKIVSHEFDLEAMPKHSRYSLQNELVAAFEVIHNVSGKDLYPNRIILEESLAPVMGEFINEKLQQ